MSVESLARKQLEAFNRRDSEAFTSCYSTDAAVSDPQYPEPLRGASAIGKDIEAWFTAFPDVRAELSRTIGTDEGYATEWTITGTHKGPLLMPDGSNVPPTEKSVTFAAAMVGRLDRNDRIAEERRYFDLAGVLGQLGLVQ